MSIIEIIEGRDPAIQQLAKFFLFGHLAGERRTISERCHDLAYKMIYDLPDSDELKEGLRKLLEAKDCFVRAVLVDG